jgi:hypothetical protein
MEYNSLLSAIPKDWRRIIKNYTGTFTLIPDCSIKINNKSKSIHKTKCNEIYKSLIKRKLVRATSIEKWEEIYFYANFDWQQIFQIPYDSSRETSIQSMQYQIIHRFFPCKYTLNIWYKTGDDSCEICGNEIDTIEHYFFYCTSVNKLWSDLMSWTKSKLNIYFTLACLDVIFGIINSSNDPVIHLVNICILYGKEFISKQKANSKEIKIEMLLDRIGKKLESEIYISAINSGNGELKDHLQTLYEECLVNGYGYC